MNNHIVSTTRGAKLPLNSTPIKSSVRQGSDDENKVTITGVFSRLPKEVTERILDALIPIHQCTQSPFDLHTCTVSYGPVVRAIASTDQSCKYLHVLSCNLRRTAHPVYRKEAAALEFSFKMRSRPEVEADLFDDWLQRVRKAEYVRMAQDVCRWRYDIDPVSDSGSQVPQFAHVNLTLALTSAEIRAINDKREQIAGNVIEELDEITLDKLWVMGKTHAVVLTEVEADSLLANFYRTFHRD